MNKTIKAKICWPWGLVFLVFCSTGTEAAAQGFSLCSVVDAKHKKMTLGWNAPQEEVNGYSFRYNGRDLTPYKPTVPENGQLSYNTGLGYGTHTFQISGFETDYNTNEVIVELKKPHYYTALIPGLYQAIHRRRYANSCSGEKGFVGGIAGVVEPIALLAATGYATVLWIQFFDEKNAALDAREAYLNTLRGEELERWRLKRDKAKDIFPKALAVSIATLTVNAITTAFLSPRGKASVQGGFSLDCATHPNRVGLCVKL